MPDQFPDKSTEQRLAELAALRGEVEHVHPAEATELITPEQASDSEKVLAAEQRVAPEIPTEEKLAAVLQPESTPAAAPTLLESGDPAINAMMKNIIDGKTTYHDLQGQEANVLQEVLLRTSGSELAPGEGHQGPKDRKDVDPGSLAHGGLPVEK